MSTTSTTTTKPSSTFHKVPVIDYSQALSSSTKPAFLDSLREAVINVGFLYLDKHPISLETVSALESYIPQLFALPQEEKEKIAMRNSPHFLGYTAFGKEFTKGRRDLREQFDFATKHQSRWREGDPDYRNLWGPSQWPEENLIPGFRETYESYMEQVSTLSTDFIALLAEAIGLEPSALLSFYDTPELMQHRSKIVQYPLVEGEEDQGVGPHYDAGFLTFLLQASSHPGLQVQNLAGEWIDAPPISGTFVVNIGKALEFATSGLARATSHRVLSPRYSAEHPGPRYSVPFFQNISLEAKLAELKERLKFSPETLAFLEKRGIVAQTESVNFTEFDREPSGRVNLIGRVKSHPDVAQIHYPNLFKQIFPQGLPATASAY